MNEWITSLINQYGYLAITFIIALENIFPPLPSEVILTMSGFMTTSTHLTVAGTIISAITGSLIGALILYTLGRQLTVERLATVLSYRPFKVLGFKTTDAQKAVQWFNRHGTGGVLYGRCIPVIRSLISIPAGIAQTPLLKFITLTIIGSALWNTVLVALGAFVGESWTTIVQIFDEYTTVAVVIMLIAVLFFGHRWYRQRIKN